MINLLPSYILNLINFLVELRAHVYRHLKGTFRVFSEKLAVDQLILSV